MENNNITNEELARMVQKGFNGVDKRFDEMDKRFDRIEDILIQNNTKRIEKLETGMTELREALALK